MVALFQHSKMSRLEGRQNCGYCWYTSYTEKLLEPVFEEAHLGVTIDCELRFEEHISKKIQQNELHRWDDLA